MNHSKNKRKFSWDEKGALEGLPLYLIILVVVAAVAIVIIFTYLSTLRTVELDRIDIYIDGEKSKLTSPGEHEVYIIAIGDDGKKLKDVTVTIVGGGANMARITDSNGKADFGSLNFTADGAPYSVDVTASYSGGNVDVPVDETITISD